MKLILAVLECTSKEFLDKCHTPNIDSLDPVCPAVAPGLASRPTISANLVGVVPQCYCDDEDCVNKKIDWGHPFLLMR